MTTGVSIECECSDARSLSALSELIALRQKQLGETTEQACIATAINVVKSIRARTRVADPEKAAGGTVGLRTDLVPSFKRLGKGGRRVPCIRIGSKKGPRYTGSWRKASATTIFDENSKCFFVRDWASEGKDKRTYIIVADSEEEAKQWATELQKRRIKRYAGMAKYALSVAMSQVNGGNASAPTAFVAPIVAKTVSASKSGSGFNAGSFAIEINDLLNYALLAVDGGASTVDLAIQKAANSTAAIINKVGSQRFSQKIETPFPEISRKK